MQKVAKIKTFMCLHIQGFYLSVKHFLVQLFAHFSKRFAIDIIKLALVYPIAIITPYNPNIPINTLNHCTLMFTLRAFWGARNWLFAVLCSPQWANSGHSISRQHNSWVKCLILLKTKFHKRNSHIDGSRNLSLRWNPCGEQKIISHTFIFLRRMYTEFWSFPQYCNLKISSPSGVAKCNRLCMQFADSGCKFAGGF